MLEHHRELAREMPPQQMRAKACTVEQRVRRRAPDFEPLGDLGIPEHPAPITTFDEALWLSSGPPPKRVRPRLQIPISGPISM